MPPEEPFWGDTPHVERVMHMLGRIDSRLATFMEETERDLDDIERRTRSLEASRSWLRGAWAAVAGLAAYVVKMKFTSGGAPSQPQ